MAALASDWLRHSRILLWNCERNSTKLDRKRDLNILYQACVFRADQKNKIAALSSDWLRHFWLLLWNHGTEFNKTWQKASSQRPLPSLCFLVWSKKQYGPPGLWLAETYFDFYSETAERKSVKLDTKQDLNVLYQGLCFSGRKVNKNCHPGQSIKEGGTLYSGARYGALWASCLWIYLGEVRGGAPIHVYVWEHIVSLY